MPKKSFQYENIQEGYYDNIFHEKKGIRSAWHHAKFEFVKQNINQKNIHLDIACGPGTFLSLLNNKKSFGVDISKIKLILLKKIWIKEQKIYYFEKKLPFKKNSLDSISLIELIEHLPLKKIQKILDDSFNCLKKTVKFILLHQIIYLFGHFLK